MKRIILSIFSVFITLGAAAETEQARPAMQQSETAADAETPSVTAESAAAPRRRQQRPPRRRHPKTCRSQRHLRRPYRRPCRRKAERPQEQRFLPTRRRIDREINKLKFAYKGEVMMGLTASYGTVSSDDTDLMLIFDNIDADATIATVKPFVGYFYRDNNCIGIRFGYSHMGGTLDNTYFDAGEGNDLSGQLPYVDLSSDEYSFGIFHRSYAGLDPKGRFGLFAEFELALSTGHSSFAYDPDHNEGGAPNRTYNDKTQVKLAFNPGAAVYIFPNVCATISFGLGGIQYTSITQKDADGNKIGSRKASNMRFRLNIAAINFGMTIHLWDKKKQ
ncbi:MAG: hypothetical protein ACLRM8_02910 [Alistipes sp.]